MRENPRFTFVPTMTQVDRSQRRWTGETGHITHALIGRYLDAEQPAAPALLGPVYYLAGPPAMVAGMRAMLNRAGVDDDDLRAEEFGGY